MPKPRRARPSRYDTITELEDQLTVGTFIENHLDDWTGPSSPGVEGGARRLGWISDPTGQQGTAKPNDTTQLLDKAARYTANLVQIEDLISANRGLKEELKPLKAAHAVEKTNVAPGGVGYCEACAEWCPGTSDTTRLKSGFCHADYQAWLRAGRPDRAGWIAQRRAAS